MTVTQSDLNTEQTRAVRRLDRDVQHEVLPC